jgi:hypothetical protein
VYWLFGVALLLGASSFYFIRKDKSDRIWDHTARSLVQLSVAAVTVAVAFALYEKQLAEQDQRLARQQSRAASAILRSLIDTLREPLELTPALFNRAIQFPCERINECNDVYRLVYDLQKQTFDTMDREGPGRFLAAQSGYRDDVRALLRTSAALSEELSDSLISASGTYERWRSGYIEKQVEIVAKYQTMLPKHDGGLIPTADLSALYLDLARIQADSFRLSAIYICRLFDINDELLKGASAPPTTFFKWGRTTVIKDNTDCSPIGSHARTVLQWDKQAR